MSKAEDQKRIRYLLDENKKLLAKNERFKLQLAAINHILKEGISLEFKSKKGKKRTGQPKNP